MMARREEDQATRREEKKEARSALTALLRRLRASCKTVGQVSDWYELVPDVEDLLDRYQHVIPPARQHRIRQALELPEATLAGVKRACSVLQFEVESLIGFLKPASAVSSILAAGLIIVAATVAVLAITANVLAVDVRVYNQGCDPVQLAQFPLSNSPVLNIAGVSLPGGPIVDGDNDVVSLPPVRLEIDNESDPGEIILRGLSSVEFPVEVGGATDIWFDDQPVLGRRSVFDLRQLDGRPEHELVIACGN